MKNSSDLDSEFDEFNGFEFDEPDDLREFFVDDYWDDPSKVA